MTPERWKQIDELFASALEWAADERSKLLGRACAGDEELRLEVQSLLDAHDQAPAGLDAPGADAGARLLLSNDRAELSEFGLRSTSKGQSPPGDGGATPLLPRGAALDRYLVLNQLGGGGMGVVFTAYDPQLDRKVAVKLLRPGAFGKMRASEGRARLLREAQSLARLSHPNVIAVYDAGTYQDQVFIAMEYIDGSTLTDWLKEGVRSWRMVLDIFLQAGRGLAAAHRAGLIHRDFKPDNVLVGDDGRVRVLDFGLAQAAQGPEAELTRETLPDVAIISRDSPLDARLTQPGLLMGTPAYMAPEQLIGLAGDARIDQFGFCVTLSEALYGELPFETPRTAVWKIKDPPKSSRVPSWLRRVILRGLRVDPRDRYRSMDELLAELARDPARRRRSALAMVGIALLIAVGPISYRYAKEQQSQLCQGGEQRLTGVWDEPRQRAMSAAFLKTKLPYAQSALGQAQGALDAYAKNWVAMQMDACKATRVRGEQSEELLDLRMECLGHRLEELKSLANLLGNADANLVSRARAATQELTSVDGCANAAALRAPIRPPDPGTRLKVEEVRRRLAAGKALLDAGKYTDGVQLLIPLGAEARALRYRPLEAEALELLGLLQDRNGDPKAAEKTIKEAILAAEAGRHDEAVASGAIRMVSLSYTQAKYEQSLEWAQRASAAIERLGGNERLLARLLTSKGTVLQRLNRFDEAIEHHQRALAIAERVLAPDDPEIAKIILNIGTVYGDQGQHAIAIEHYRRSLEMSERSLGPWHPDIGYQLNNIGLNQRLLGNYDEALSYLHRAVELREQALGKEHPHVATSLSNIGDVLSAQNKHSEALAYYQRAVPLYEKAFGPKHPRLGWPLTGIGIAYLQMNGSEKAIAPLERAVSLREGQPGNATDLAKTRFALARALRRAGLRLAEARTLAQQARTAYAAAGQQADVEQTDAWLNKHNR